MSEEKLEITAENKKTGLNKRTEPIRPPRTKDFIPFPSHSSTGDQKTELYTLKQRIGFI